MALKMELEGCSCWQGSHIAGILSLSPNGQFVVDTVARKNTSNAQLNLA